MLRRWNSLKTHFHTELWLETRFLRNAVALFSIVSDYDARIVSELLHGYLRPKSEICLRKKILTKISFFRSSDTIERISRAFAQANTHRIELRKRYSSDRDLYFFVRPHTHASSLNSVGFHGNETHTSMVAFSAEQIQTYASWCYELLRLDRIPINI